METVVINQIKDQSYTMKESLRALKTSISFSGKGVKSILLPAACQMRKDNRSYGSGPFDGGL